MWSGDQLTSDYASIKVDSTLFSLAKDLCTECAEDRHSQKMKFSIKDFFNKCDQMGNFIFCAVRVVGNLFNFVIELPSPHPQW